MALIRISEPYVWADFIKVMRPKFCRQKRKIAEVKFSNESLYSFMVSAMNMEYVCVILVGISKSDGRQKLDINNYNLPTDERWDVSSHHSEEKIQSIN